MGNELLRTDNCISETVEKYADLVFRLALVYLKNKDDAEDASQEVFLRLFKVQKPFNSDEHIKAWLITVTGNYCKNQLKSFWHKKTVPFDEILLPIKDEDKRELVTEVLNLPLKYRDVIYLYYYEGYKAAEISQIKHVNESTVRTRLARGRKLLKVELTGGLAYEK